MATLNFNAAEAPADDFDTLPAGEYTAQIIQSEMKDTKSGTGQYLEMRVQILDEPFTGRLIFERLNLVNPNNTAVMIAQRTLAQICKALDIESLEDSEELHFREMNIKVGIRPPKGDFPASNEIKKYSVA
jgi:hypothetical protein